MRHPNGRFSQAELKLIRALLMDAEAVSEICREHDELRVIRSCRDKVEKAIADIARMP